MNDLDRWRLLFRVADLGSIVAAANELGVEASSVSRRISALEKAMGCGLLNRSTRRTSLSPHAEAMRETLSGIIGEWDQALDRLKTASASVNGVVVVAAPHGMGQDIITPLVFEFYRQYPDIEVEIQLSDTPVLPGAGSADISFMYGPIDNPDIITRPVWTSNFVVCASPQYIDSAGTPAHPCDFASHTLLLQDSAYRPRPDVLIKGYEVCAIQGGRVLRTNDALSLRRAALAHTGICIDLPEYLCHEDLRQGRLVRILQGWSANPIPLYAVRSSRESPSRSLSIFFDWISARLQRTAESWGDLAEAPYRQAANYLPMWGGA